MERRSMLAVVLLLAAIPLIASAQTTSRRKSGPAEPPDLKYMLAKASNPIDGSVSGLLVFEPEIPLGPMDVLKSYEDGMVLITQKLSNDLASILQAKVGNQITPGRAEYLINERYQIAIMQHQVLSALHESLEEDLDAAGSAHSVPGNKSNAAAAPHLPSSLDQN